MEPLQLWKRYQKHLCNCPGLGISLDISRMNFSDDFFTQMKDRMALAYDAMARLEAGEIANPDENRMVGHYWLRNPGLAPNDNLAAEITRTLGSIKLFAADVHAGRIRPPQAKKFTQVILVGIGGSALGPQLVSDALTDAAGPSGTGKDKMAIHFLDNTDPDGFDRLLSRLKPRLKTSLVLVISKSGGTKETRNGMLEVAKAYTSAGLNFAEHAVAITGEGSELHVHAQAQHWLRSFPMWDWVGGRTSVMSAVGLLPAALQGVDIQAFLDGASAMDSLTRQQHTPANPAAVLALMWHYATEGKGSKDMVMLPYKDRLLLMSRYLQQLVMESLGKKLDLAGNVVHQGIAVYGNKGSTDQHAYVQQLRDGLLNFFVTFIVVLQDRARGRTSTEPFTVEPQTTSGDYLNGFWQGTRQALYDAGRESITLTLEKINARTLGAVIALYERAVGFYATLVNINAYHQPGVEAGKKAAAAVLQVQNKVLAHLEQHPEAADPASLATAIGMPEQAETVHHVLQHLAYNKRGIARSGRKFKLQAVKR